LHAQAYGDLAWRYTHDSPAPFLSHASRKRLRSGSGSSASAGGDSSGAGDAPHQQPPDQPDMERSRLAAVWHSPGSRVGKVLETVSCGYLTLPGRTSDDEGLDALKDPCMVCSCLPWGMSWQPVQQLGEDGMAVGRAGGEGSQQVACSGSSTTSSQGIKWDAVLQLFSLSSSAKLL
jgi:hypothetical protein